MSQNEDQTGMSPLQHHLPAEFQNMLSSQDPDKLAKLFVMGERAGDLLSVLKSSHKNSLQVIPKQAAEEGDDEGSPYENEELNPVEENRDEVSKELAAGIRTLFGHISKGSALNDPNLKSDPKKTVVYQAIRAYIATVQSIREEDAVKEDPELVGMLDELLEKVEGDLSGDNRTLAASIEFNYLGKSTNPEDLKKRIVEELYPFEEDPFEVQAEAPEPKEPSETGTSEVKEKKPSANKDFHPGRIPMEYLAKDSDLQANVGAFTQLSDALGLEDKAHEVLDEEGNVVKTAVSRPEKTDILVHELAESVEKSVPEWDAESDAAKEKVEQALKKGLDVIRSASFFRNLNETPNELLGSMVNYMSDPHNMHALLQSYRQQGHIRKNDEESGSKPYKALSVQHHLWLGLPHPGDTNFSKESREELAAMSQDLQDYVNSNEALYASALAKGEVPHPTGDIEVQIVSSPTISGSAAMKEALITKIIRIGNKRYASTDAHGMVTEEYSPSKNPEKVYEGDLTKKTASLSAHSISANLTAAAKDLLNDYERMDHVVTAPTEENLTELFTKWFAVTALYGKGKDIPESLVLLYSELFQAGMGTGAKTNEEAVSAFLNWISSPGKILSLPQIGTKDMLHVANKLGKEIKSAFETRANKNAHILLKFVENQSTFSKDSNKSVVFFTKELMEALPHLMSEDMMVKGLLEYPELRQAIHESTSGSIDRLKVLDALHKVFGEVGKKGWAKAVNDYVQNPAENDLVSAIVRIGSILIESKDPNKVAIGSSLVNNPGQRAEELSKIVKGSLLRNQSEGKITTNAILAFEDMFGHGGKHLHTTKNKSETSELPKDGITGENRNLLYISGNWDRNNIEAPTNVKVGQTYRLVYEPNWQIMLYGKVRKNEDDKSKKPGDVAKEEKAKEGPKGGRMSGYLFSIKGNAPVVHFADKRLGVNEIPRFVEFAAKRFAATKLGGSGASAGRRVSPDMMDDEGNSANFLENIPEDIQNSYLAKSDWDANSGIKRALRGKPFKVVRETLKNLKDRKLLELENAKSHGAYHVNADGSLSKRPAIKGDAPSLADEMLETGPSSSEVSQSELNLFIRKLTRKLPTIDKKDIAGKNIQEVMALLSTSRQVTDLFLEDALDPEQNLGKTNAILNTGFRKQYNGADFDHLAWFDGALRAVMKTLDVEGMVEQVSDESRKKEFVAGNPAISLVSKMVEQANNNVKSVGKLPEYIEKWQEAAQQWNSTEHTVKFEDMFKTTAEKSLRTSNELSTMKGLLAFFEDIHEVSSNGVNVQDYPDFNKFLQVVNASAGPSVELVKDEKNKAVAKVTNLRQLANTLLNDPTVGGAIEAKLDALGVKDTYMPTNEKTLVYQVKDTADPAQVAKFVEENSAHGKIGKMLLAYGGKEASYSVASLMKEIKRKEKKPGIVNPVTGEDETDSPRWKKQVQTGFAAMCKSLAKVSGGLKGLQNTHGGIINAIEHAVTLEAQMKGLGDPTALFRGFVLKCLSNLRGLKQNQEKRELAKGGPSGAAKTDYDNLTVQNKYIGSHMPTMFLNEVHSNRNRKELLDILKETITAKSSQDKELKLTDKTLQAYRDGLVQFFSDPKIAEIAAS